MLNGQAHPVEQFLVILQVFSVQLIERYSFRGFQDLRIRVNIIPTLVIRIFIQVVRMGSQSAINVAGSANLDDTILDHQRIAIRIKLYGNFEFLSVVPVPSIQSENTVIFKDEGNHFMKSFRWLPSRIAGKQDT